MRDIDQIFNMLISQVEKKGVPGNFSNLREKGVECAIIMPLIQYLGYDALIDVQYEVSSKKRNDQRFDFMVGDAKYLGDIKEQYNIIIETKSLETNIGVDAYGSKQIRDYIIHHDDIHFGILTNGIDYIFFLSKEFIIKELEKNSFETPVHGNILPILSIGREEMGKGYTKHILNMISKELYIENIRKLGQLTYKIITGEGNKNEKLVPDNEINTFIKEKMEKDLIGQRGDYYECLVLKQCKVGDTIIHKGDILSIQFRIDKFGRLFLQGKEAIIINKANELLLQEYGRNIVELVSSLSTNKEAHIYNGLETFLTDMYNASKKVSSQKVFAQELRSCFDKFLGKK